MRKDRAVPFSSFNFKNDGISAEEKQKLFFSLSVSMKRYHERGFCVKSFNADSVTVDHDLRCDFDNIGRMNTDNKDEQQEIIFNDVVSLADFAFCCYLPSYDLKQGLLNPNVVGDSIDRFKNIIPELDYGYFKEIFGSLESKKLPEYYNYCDYVVHLNKASNNSKGNSLVKQNAGAKYINYDNDDIGNAAFANTFFMVTVVAAMSLLLLYLCLIVS